MPEPGSEITYSIQGAELYPGKLKHQMGISEKHMDTAKKTHRDKTRHGWKIK